MVDDLLSKHQLVGRTRSEIDNLLGVPPPNRNYFEGTDYYKHYDYVYWIGEQEGLFGSYEWLVIKFKNNIVNDARLISEWDLLDPPS
jgi:hypothetical protein